MAAKLSDLGDKMSEANLQVDGQVERQPKEQQTGGRQKKRTVPLMTHDIVPCPEAAVGPPQYKTLLRNTSDFNR